MSNFGFWILDFGFRARERRAGDSPSFSGDGGLYRSICLPADEGMTERELKLRTKAFAREVLRLVDALPNSRSGRILAAQLGRSATSVGANYRAACRSRSVAEMVSKISVVEEEADESGYWLELISDQELAAPERIVPLAAEASELTAIMVASRQTLQRRMGKLV